MSEIVGREGGRVEDQNGIGEGWGKEAKSGNRSQFKGSLSLSVTAT